MEATQKLSELGGSHGANLRMDEIHRCTSASLRRVRINPPASDRSGLVAMPKMFRTRSILVITSKALVTRSDALVPSSVLVPSAGFPAER